jgi:hypothetical protein
MKVTVRRSPWLLALLGVLLLSACSRGIDTVPALEPLRTPTTLRIPIVAASDDAEEIADGRMELHGGLLDFSAKRGVPQTVGLRFQNLAIPRGARITSAHLEVRAGLAHSNPVTLQVRAQAADNAPTFTSARHNISSRPTTAAVATWRPLAWTQGRWGRSSDLREVIQEVVDRSGWRSGNALALIVTGDGRGERAAIAFGQNPANVPVLVVSFESTQASAPATAPAAPAPSTSGSLRLPLASPDDDIEETADGTIRTGASTRSLDFSVEAGVAQSVGLRFTDVTVPQGAKITRAHIDFRASAADAGALTLTVRGINADNTPRFTTARYNLSQRPTTAASALWRPRPWEVGQAVRTADLSAIVQEIVNRPQWRSGNAMAFIVSGDGRTKRSAVSRDVSAADGPTLHITYEVTDAPAPPAPPPAPTPAPDPTPAPEPAPPAPQPEPTPPAPQPEPAPGSKGPRGSYTTLRANPNFSRNQLPAEVRVWYDRLMNALEHPKYHTHPALATSDPMQWAASGDLFLIGRSLNTHVTTLITVFRITRDPQLLDEIDRLMQLARAELRDYDGDGYLNWRYLTINNDPSNHPFIGGDFHEMDEILTHALVAAVAYVYQQNASNTRYAERAAFWTDYLKNHFEAKWRQRKNRPTGFPFITKELTHAYSQWIRYHYYMGKLMGESSYTAEARRMANNVAKHMVEVDSPAGPAFVWDHRISDVRRYSNMGCQMFVYLRYTMQAFQDLALEEFSVFADRSFMNKVANGFTSFVMDDDINSYAPTICGSSDRGGLLARATTRGTRSLFAGRPYHVVGPWDSTGKMLDATMRTYAVTEAFHMNSPRKTFLPAAMVFMLATQ